MVGVRLVMILFYIVRSSDSPSIVSIPPYPLVLFLLQPLELSPPLLGESCLLHLQPFDLSLQVFCLEALDLSGAHTQNYGWKAGCHV